MIRKIYSRLSLSQKIIIPFLSIFFSVMVVGTMTIGYWFTESLEDNYRRDVNGDSVWVMRQFKEREELLISQAVKVAEMDVIRQAVAGENRGVLIQNLLQVKVELNLDLLAVVDAEGKVLVDLRQGKLNEVKLRDREAVRISISGLPASDLIDVEDRAESVLAGMAPIKSRDKFLGGIIFGKVVSDDLLVEVRDGIKEHLVAFSQSRAIASTFPEAVQISWQPPALGLLPEKTNFDKHEYLVKTVALGGLNQDALKVALLYPITALKAAKYGLWVRVWVLFGIGALIVAIAGMAIARAIARPLVNLIRVTQQLAAGNLGIYLAITSNDEVGKLSQAFNLMAEQLAERDRALNIQLHQLSQALQDLKNTQSQLIQAEKMSSLGQLVAGIAHEINNPVNFINGNIGYINDYTKNLLYLIQLYRESYPNPTPEIKETIETIELDYLTEDLTKILGSMKIGVERITQTILSLRNFSRLDESEMKAINIHDGINSTIVILNHRLKQGIEIIKKYENLPKVECYPALLNQVFMNLLANAIDALEEAKNQRNFSPAITITTEAIDQNIVVRIADNGAGIPAEVKKKIFDPFFTTKPVGKGTGLGLSISFKIIEKHQGKIEVNSQIGAGTEFAIFIPVKRFTANNSGEAIASKSR